MLLIISVRISADRLLSGCMCVCDTERAKEAAAAATRARYQAMQLSRPEGDRLPPDFYSHEVHSDRHLQTMHVPGEIYRPSRPRVGTTVTERFTACQRLREEQEGLAARAREEQRVEDARARAAAAPGEYVPVARSSAPHYATYNLPPRPVVVDSLARRSLEWQQAAQ